MKKIDFEAHFLTEDYIESLYQNNGFPRILEDYRTKSRDLYFSDGVALRLGDRIRDKLLDLGEGRLKDLDRNGIDEPVTLADYARLIGLANAT